MLAQIQNKNFLGLNLYNIAVIALATLISAVAFNGFIIPNNLLSGGVTGISIIAFYLTGIPTSLLIFVLNMPLFLLGSKYVDRDFAINSFIAMCLFSLFMSLTEGIHSHFAVNDLMIEAIIGGVLNGISMGLLFSVKSSQGGMDIVGAIIKRKWNVPIASVLMTINLIIIGFSSFLFGLRLATYTLIALFISYQIVAKIQKGFNPEKTAMIITKQSDDIKTSIIEKLQRGATVIEGKGAYSNDDKEIIYCTLSNMEIGQLNDIVEDVDPEAFITIIDLQEVRGRGFKKAAI